MARCQHLPMGFRPGTPPTPTLGGGLSCPFVTEGILLGVGEGVEANIEVPPPEPRVWSLTHLWGPAREEMDRTGPWREHRIGDIKTPQVPALPPHCSLVGDSISKGGQLLLPPSQSLLSLRWAGRGGRQRYLFISFIYLIFL